MESKAFKGLAGILIFFGWSAFAQPQIVLLKKEQVIYRLVKDQDIQYQLSGKKEIITGTIMGAWEFGFITQADSVLYSEIRKINTSDRPAFSSRVGKLFIIAGAGYFLIDQVNEGLLSGNGFSITDSVWKPTVLLVATGGLLKITRKRWHYPGTGKIRFHTANPDSPFYLSDN